MFQEHQLEGLNVQKLKSLRDRLRKLRCNIEEDFEKIRYNLSGTDALVRDMLQDDLWEEWEDCLFEEFQVELMIEKKSQ